MNVVTLAKQCTGECSKCKHKRLCDRWVKQLTERNEKNENITKRN